jgi:hypothetical protein
MQYVTESILRDRAQAAQRAKNGQPLNDKEREQAEAWIVSLVEKARLSSHLMTETQYTDWTMGRRLAPGDRCKYIGPTRTEDVDGRKYMRKHGQEGSIIRLEAGKDGNILVFSPAFSVPPVEGNGEPMYVSLVVRENTAGWLQLERIW